MVGSGACSSLNPRNSGWRHKRAFSLYIIILPITFMTQWLEALAMMRVYRIAKLGSRVKRC